MSKRYLIIGAGPGMGAASARRFADEGFAVTLAARNETKLDALADEMRSAGNTVATAAIDAADADSVMRLVREVAPDVLHYNAAVIRRAGQT